MSRSIDDLKRWFSSAIEEAIEGLVDIEKKVDEAIAILDKSIKEHDCYG